MNIEPYSRTDFERARMTVQIISRFLIGLCEQGMLLYGVYIYISSQNGGKELTSPENHSLTSLDLKFFTCSTVDFPKKKDLQVTTRTVKKIIPHFQCETLSSFSHGGREPRKVKDDVLQRIES